MALNLSCKLLKNKQVYQKTLSCSVAAQSVAKYKAFDDIPGPKSIPFVGNLFSLKQFGGEFNILDYKQFQIEIQAKYGDIVKWNLFGKKECFVFNPKYVKEIFKVDGSMPKRVTLEPLTMLQNKLKLQNTLVNSNGERWKALRSSINPILARPQTIISYLPNHNTVADEFIDLFNRKFHESNTIYFESFDKQLRRLALEYISEIVFNKRIYCVDESKTYSDSQKFVDAVGDFTVYMGRLLFSPPIWKFYETHDLKKFYEAGEFIFKIAKQFILEAQDNLKKMDEKDQNNKETVLAQFLERRVKYGLTLDDVVSTTIDLINGGIDTTSITLHYMFYELGTKKHIQKRLFDEISTYLKPGEQLSEDKLEKLRYLKNITKETLRVYNIAPGNSRILQHDIVLDDYLIPSGTIMSMGTNFIVQSDRYFRNAKMFDPSRWDKIDSSEDIIDPYAFLPFGFGARMCIGRRTAEQEIYITAAKIIQNYEVDYIGEKPGYRIGLIATPDRPLNLKFTKRNN